MIEVDRFGHVAVRVELVGAQDVLLGLRRGQDDHRDDLEHGMRIYREAGGTNAVLANVGIDLAGRPESAALVEITTSLVCPPDEARSLPGRSRRLADRQSR